MGKTIDLSRKTITEDKNGNAWFQGNVSIDGTPTNDNDLITKKYVDDIGEQYVTQDQLNTSLNNLKLRQITQAEYDALENKDPNTLYIITE